MFDDSRARNKPLTFLIGIGATIHCKFFVFANYLICMMVCIFPSNKFTALTTSLTGSVIKGWDEGIAQLPLGGM